MNILYEIFFSRSIELLEFHKNKGTLTFFNFFLKLLIFQKYKFI